MKLFIIPFFLFSLLPQVELNAQDFTKIQTLCDSCNNELYIGLESTFFNKNNEYFTDFTRGFTGFGAFVKPSLQYYLGNSIKFEAGAFLLQNFGQNGLNQVLPLFRFEHSPIKGLRLVAGSIYGTLKHQLEEPLLRFDRYYQDHMEYGSQILYTNSFLRADAWINWDVFIERNDPFQEEMEIGLSADFTLLNSPLKVEVPVQLLLEHKGGQIDNSPEPIAFIHNAMSGLDLELFLTEDQSIRFRPLFFYYTSFKNRENSINTQLFDRGQAFYGQIHYERPHFNAMIGYWSADRFIAANGEFLFYSVSQFQENFSQAQRSLINSKIEIHHGLIEGVDLGVRGDFYYSTINNTLDYSFGIYTLINQHFFVGKTKSIPAR